MTAQLDLARACGFSDIETIGFHDLPPQEMARQIADSGLTVRSAHFDWEEFEARFDEIPRLLRRLSCEVTVMPWLSPDKRPDTINGWRAIAEQLAEWADQLAAQGIRLAFHNHDFDLVDLGRMTALDVILSHQDLHWQPDIGWLAVSVPDPAALLRRYADRIVSVHAKDADPSQQGDARWRNLGQGVVDWPSVLGVLSESPCSDLFVEHDETFDHAETLRVGRAFLTQHLSVEVP
ncbi:sugar phosphate isomerase/epimerase family protein [Ruegeria sp.]|uniref:sugar phosphate isomerase/epimerase family protein n=1 Tax=Ruegeria sp. TaxID=1879320 RepID=UPI003B5B51BF